jgi:hypothetical protein
MDSFFGNDDRNLSLDRRGSKSRLLPDRSTPIMRNGGWPVDQTARP